MNELLKNVEINTHSSIRINRLADMYFDPFRITDETESADIIFITHSHYDHFSPEDINKVSKPDSILVMPESMEREAIKAGIDEDSICSMDPGDEFDIVVGDSRIHVEAVPSYNVGKDFHPEKNRWLGYVVTAGDIRYYIPGDMDENPDALKVKCDVAFVPCGGTYTMDFREAADFVNKIKPQIAVPMHYGSVAGDSGCGVRFSELIEEGIETEILIK